MRRYSLSARSCAPLLLAVGLAIPRAPAQIQYSQIATGPARTEHGLVYDSGRDRIVLFGGGIGSANFNETWEFNGTGWMQRTPALRPPPRTRPAMAYDAARGVVVMFGGFDGNNMLNDTWTWDGTAWSQQLPASRPSVRSGTAMAYDSARQVVVLFGGWVPSGNDNAETWEWNGSNWSQRSPVASPPARGAHRLAYDGRRDVVLMFGGWNTPQNTTVGDTWTFDGSTWTSQSTPTRPTNRCDQGMAYDEDRDRIVLFGGLERFLPVTFSPVVVGDTWDWDGTMWQQRTATGAPGARAYTETVWDSGRRRLVLHGGFDASSTYNTTHSLVPTNAGTVTAFGAGCVGGNGGVPALESVPHRMPYIGDTFDARVSGANPTASLAFMVLGLSNTTWNSQPLPLDLTLLGMPGCQAFISAHGTQLMLLTNGTGTWTGALCDCPPVIGANLYLQALILDSGVMRPLPGTMTNALDAMIGAR